MIMKMIKMVKRRKKEQGGIEGNRRRE